MIVADSVTTLPANTRGEVHLSGSHGGSYSAYLAARAGARAVILNDAGVGRDRAGIGGLALLDTIGMSAATLSHRSARIGDGDDGWQRVPAPGRVLLGDPRGSRREQSHGAVLAERQGGGIGAAPL